MDTMRLNFSNADESAIEEGIRRLGRCIEEYMGESRTHNTERRTQEKFKT